MAKASRLPDLTNAHYVVLSAKGYGRTTHRVNNLQAAAVILADFRTWSGPEFGQECGTVTDRNGTVIAKIGTNGSFWTADERSMSSAEAQEWISSRLYAPTLPGLVDASERVHAQAVAESTRLTDLLRSPLKDVSAKSGAIERESPLFYGTGSNPLLF